MKVKVVKCYSVHWWYSNQIGQVFEVEDLDKTDFRVIDNGLLLYKDDVEVVDESPQQTDPHIEAIRQMLLERSNTGISKYGTTLARSDLKPSQWAQHLLEELLDAAGYVHRLKTDLEQIENMGRGEK